MQASVTVVSPLNGCAGQAALVSLVLGVPAGVPGELVLNPSLVRLKGAIDDACPVLAVACHDVHILYQVALIVPWDNRLTISSALDAIKNIDCR